MRSFLSELGERFGVSGAALPEKPIWLHAASVGEAKAVKNLAAILKEKFPAAAVMITTSTWAGRTEALKLTPHARLLPLDFYPFMKKFITRARPGILLIAETEIWPNMLVCAAAAGVKICIINGRMSQKTLILYRIFFPLTAKIFSGVEKILAASVPDAANYAKLLKDDSKVAVTGNMKYDALDTGPDKLEGINVFLKKISWTGKTVWTAASTHRGEEEAILDSYLALKKTSPGLKLVIVPRHPERAGETRALLALKNIPFIVWSDRARGMFPYSSPFMGKGEGGGRETSPFSSPLAGEGEGGGSPDCLLVDEIGWLINFYSLSAAAFVGGTLVNVGGHNLLEPASFSKPVLFGPYVQNTREAAEMLLKTRGGFMVEDGEELRARLAVLLKDPKLLKTAGGNAKKALENLQGATAKTIAIIEKYVAAQQQENHGDTENTEKHGGKTP